MNVSPNIEPSAAPFAAHGEVTDRMIGSFGGSNRSPVDEFRKTGTSPPHDEGDLKKFEGELKRPSVNKPPVDKPSIDSEKLQTVDKIGLSLVAEKPKSSNPSGDKTDPKKRRARKKWKKPKDKPNRPLSAYNLFFQSERASMLGDEAKLHELEKGKKRIHRKTHGKIGFADLARSIGQKWKDLPEEQRKPFLEIAGKEKDRYAVELKAWKEEQKLKPKTKSLVAALKAESRAAEKEGSASVDDSEPKEKSRESLKLQMMAEEINQRNIVLMQQRQENEYLRALQERQMALLASRSQIESSMFQQYPSAAEASANAILQQFQAMPGNVALGGMNHPMAMNMGMGMGPMNMSMGMGPMNMGMGMGPMNMNMGGMGINMTTMGPMGIMAPAEFQQLGGRSSQLGTANRLQQLRGGFGTGMGDLAMGGSNNNANNMGVGQGDLGRLEQLSAQFGNNDMAAAMARRFQQGRYSM